MTPQPSQRSWALLLFLSACTVHLSAPEDALIACRSAADCPPDLPVCSPSIGTCFNKTIAADVTPPVFLGAAASSLSSVLLTFDEAVALVSAQDISVDGGAIVLDVARENAEQLRITTTSLKPGVAYGLTLNMAVDAAGNASSAQTVTFLAPGPVANPLPPTLITPAEGTVFGGLTVDFAWSERAGSTTYRVQMTNVDTGVLVVDQVVESTLLTLTLPDDGRYSWQVASDVSPDKPSETRSFSVLGACVRVYCSAADGSCAGGIGTKAKPRKSLSEGVRLADSLALDCVEVAGRGGDAAYPGPLLPVRAGTRVVGGFSPSFLSGGDPTYIGSAQTAAVSLRGVDNVTLERLSIRYTGSDAAVVVFAANDIVLRDITVVTDAFPNMDAIDVSNSARVTIANSTLAVGPSGSLGAELVTNLAIKRSTGVLIDTSRVTLDANWNGYAVHAIDSEVTMRATDVVLGKGTSTTACSFAKGVRMDGGTLVFERGRAWNEKCQDVTLFLMSGGNLTIDSTIVDPGSARFGSSAITASFGVATNLRVMNSVLASAVDGYSPHAIVNLNAGGSSIADTTQALFSHNLFVLRNSLVSAESTAFFTVTSVPNAARPGRLPVVATNNVFYPASATATTWYALYEVANLSQPPPASVGKFDAFVGNVVAFPATAAYVPYRRNDGALLTNLNAVTGYTGNRVGVFSVTGFVGAPGPTALTAPPSATPWRWTSALPLVETAASKLSTDTNCGEAADQSCGNVTVDFDGVVRGASTSVGPFHR